MNGSKLALIRQILAKSLLVSFATTALRVACVSPANAREPSAQAPVIPSGPRITLLEAVRETLAHDPNIQLQQQQVEANKGLLQIATGQFDPAFSTALSQGITRVPRTESERISSGVFTEPAVQNATIYRAGITNQFRNGVSVDTGIELDRFEDNLFQTQPANRANVSFVLRVPLLRGAGRAAVDAFEQAARVNHEAALFDLQQAIAARLLNTVSAYWNCLAAQEQLQVLTSSQQRAGTLVEAVQALVRIGEMAASELLQAQADNAQKTAAVSSGEQALWQARQDLAQAIGYALDRMNDPPTPGIGFPEVDTNRPAIKIDERRLIVRSLERRADFQSSQKAQQAARILEVAARKNLRPQLDVSLEAGYSGLNEANGLRSYFASLNPRVVSGPNLLGTISLDWPFGNHAAKGLLLERTAELRQSQLRAEALERSIQAGVLVALKDLDNSRLGLEKSQLAVQDYAQSVAHEQAKLRLRTITILDFITLADRMDLAHLNEVTARARYWTALARIRYETGWLVRPGATPEAPIAVEDLITLPPWVEEMATKPK